MALSLQIATDMTAFQLEEFISPKSAADILQHVANKPLLEVLEKNKEEFGAAGPAAGTSTPPNVREAVQGKLMKDNPSNYIGISGNDTLQFGQSQGAIFTTAPVRMMHTGFEILHDELMQQGIVITKDNNATSTKEEKFALLDLLKTRKADYLESLLFCRNQTLWANGLQDAKAIAGIKSIITDDPTVGTRLGIDAGANTWWRHISRTGVGGALPMLVYSKDNQSMTETILRDILELTKYGGRPTVWMAGADAYDMATKEARAKGTLTMTGFTEGNTQVQVQGVAFARDMILRHDPTLDMIGESKRIYAWDPRHLRLRPQKKEWGRVINQNQPYDQLVMLISTIDRGTLSCNQMDCNYVAQVQ